MALIYPGPLPLFAKTVVYKKEKKIQMFLLNMAFISLAK